ncbi:UDP-N-acetylmuramoyl-tripeptide--D-alanyl-D-alanine ligase [Oceanobacillus halophilus]|uniref:UDP-N-acetylmuramoyl-tripeptide--D-alanyl-D-alanine ligase n=1 Tax=Oceanobacillus halophilus TaxID=930130 RepID=A0A495ABI9_9BACI|nr:UDP-N-acetylmuramoyl-tripeptide--D-alanyl-D-alanine ligase [Oceanobacillus halophilus]RKQ37397.1 UDP-N-acetylmuramoyl-tripeptide--D-alanyl-D-alanine ligase [Oceanobacillus halophilus]
MLFTTKSLITLFPTTQGKVDEPIEIHEVNTDSRIDTSNSLFIPLVGENFDGHQFVMQALEQGAVAVLWEKERTLPSSIPNDFPVFFVEDTLDALQKLASYYREMVNPIVIGITGSNGKTTTKDLVASVVKSSFVTHYTNGNFNNHIGMPLTILSMERGTEVLILEMGMSGFGEIDLLSKIAKPDYAIITNIGESHIEFLGSREGIAKAKIEILNGLSKNGKVIIDGDESLLQLLHNKTNTITCGFGDANDLSIVECKVTAKETIFTLSDGETYKVPLFGKHHAKNASFAIAISDCLGIDVKKRQDALLSVQKTGMRFDLIKGMNGVTIINDAYNASPTSMKAAIEVVKEMEGFQEKVLVLGDVLELGDHAEYLHESVADVIESPITAVFTLGEYAKLITQSIERNNTIHSQHLTSKEELLEVLMPYMREDTLVLFKASRRLKFETLIQELIN